MPIAEFEEKQYETHANLELGFQHAGMFPAGQMLEAVVGYDIATDPPQNAPIWRLIGTNAPKGIQLKPNLWQRARAQPKAPELPSDYVSLILQYKRPRYLESSLAAQWNYWNNKYYRFIIDQNQQDILEHLESALSNKALIRYACPAFWKYADLQTHQRHQSVLSHSTFVSPARLVGHTAWTYRSPGTIGYANLRPAKVPTDNFTGLWKSLDKTGKKKKENLFQHLRGLRSSIGELITENNQNDPWTKKFDSKNQLNQTQLQAVSDIVELSEHFGRTGSSWFVVDLDIKNP